ncbi:hypothetical protein EI42_02408 [Thermosporothrix hazakensis]|uniref:Uncharacterized protein n=1 Tax=Thermosporothrix hazakensis TaxID=644383 RepID=A0A326UI00_THEHA|nr:hypothetical protein EI42_02408 [Thermosporothrix hazakensis]
MLDMDPFLTILSVVIDELCQAHVPAESVKPGRKPSLTSANMLTLALLSQ